MIIGLTGSYCAGKDSAANYLVKNYKFIHYSLSDMLREELRSRRKKVTRENLIKIGKELRTKHGYSVLAEKASKKFKGKKDYVITSIRHPAEIDALQKHENFYLVDVDSPPRLRFGRMLRRRREEDPTTFKEFLESERRESQTEGAGQQLGNCRKMAKIVIFHKTDRCEDLFHKVDRMLNDLRKKEEKKEPYVRPSWDEYFMKIAKLIGSRGTCDRGRNGAVIVKDKRIISTGYVGSPVGLPHCDEVGHLIHSVINPDGKISKHCIRTAHAEQNAIVQAALHGVSTKGATLYAKFESCFICAKMIINAGIKRVVCERRYHAAQLTRKFFKEAGVELVCLIEEIEDYPDQ